MRIRRRTVIRAILTGFLLLLVTGVAAPFIRADRYGQRIKAAMERGLNRKVDIGRVKFNLFTGPGFIVEDVVIYDDPNAGVEPFAHMPELEARLRLTSLIAGRLEFARLRFVEPSVNIVKPKSGPWNIAPLLQRSAAATGSTKAVQLPEIQVSGGRINFKFDDTKTSFYFTNADVTVAPRSSEKGAFLVHFSGEPARTDRSSQSFGEFTASGRLLTGSGESRLEIDAELENGDIADLAALLRGHSFGMHGLIESTAKIYGPLSNLQILGTLHVDDVHRWDLMPLRKGGVGLKYRGALNTTTELLELSAGARDNPGMPASVRLLVQDVLSRPRWSADLSVDGMPATALVEVARHMGAPVPSELNVRGNVVGVVGYGQAAGLQGQLSISGATVKLGEGPELPLRHAQLLVSGDELRLTPASVSNDGRSAEIEAVYSPTRQQFNAVVRGRSLPIADLASGNLIATGATPVIERFSGGTWSGWVRYTSNPENPSTWTANLDVRDTTTRIPGIAAPLRIEGASVEIDGPDVTVRRMKVGAGRVRVSGDYRYTEADNRHTFNLVIPAASAAEIEALLMPSLRRNKSLLARMNLARATLPEWLRRRRAEGRIHISALTLGDLPVRQLQTRVNWNGTTLKFSNIDGRLEQGEFTATGILNLAKNEPEYTFDGRLTGIPWQGGSVDMAGTIRSGGTGSDLLLNLRSKGTFEGESLELLPEQPVRNFSGAYTLSVQRSGPQLQLTSVQAAVGGERFAGQGSTLADGRLQLELASANRTMHLAGPLTPLRLEITTERAAGNPR